MDNQLDLYFNILKINKFFSKCATINQNDYIIKFQDVNFVSIPKIFVTVHKFTITYGAEGSLEKKSVKYNVTRDQI